MGEQRGEEKSPQFFVDNIARTVNTLTLYSKANLEAEKNDFKLPEKYFLLIYQVSSSSRAKVNWENRSFRKYPLEYALRSTIYIRVRSSISYREYIDV